MEKKWCEEICLPFIKSASASPMLIEFRNETHNSFLCVLEIRSVDTSISFLWTQKLPKKETELLWSQFHSIFDNICFQKLTWITGGIKDWNRNWNKFICCFQHAYLCSNSWQSGRLLHSACHSMLSFKGNSVNSWQNTSTEQGAEFERILFGLDQEPQTPGPDQIQQPYNNQPAI